MSRILPVFLALTFLLGTLGLKVNQHFCCGELVHWEWLTGQTPRDCSGNIPVQKKKCCEDKVQVFKTDQSKPSAQNSTLPPLPWVALPRVGALFDPAFRVCIALGMPQPETEAPPPNLVPGLPIFLQIRSLRI